MTSTVPFTNFDVKGLNGLFYMTASNTLTLTTNNNLNVNSGRNINVVNNNDVKATSMSISSRNNVIFEAKADVSFNLASINMRTESIAGGVSGDIKINAGRNLALTSATGRAAIRARNNL